MKRLIGVAAACAFILAAAEAQAAMRSVTLAIDGMYCAACPHIVKQTLTAVHGVSNVAISLEEKTAFIDYDDALTEISALINATAAIGYTSRQVQ
jgi:periplasmic mercuric ion binding protein